MLFFNLFATNSVNSFHYIVYMDHFMAFLPRNHLKSVVILNKVDSDSKDAGFVSSFNRFKPDNCLSFIERPSSTGGGYLFNGCLVRAGWGRRYGQSVGSQGEFWVAKPLFPFS
jgi:hypothetical protein